MKIFSLQKVRGPIKSYELGLASFFSQLNHNNHIIYLLVVPTLESSVFKSDPFYPSHFLFRNLPAELKIWNIAASPNVKMYGFVELLGRWQRS